MNFFQNTAASAPYGQPFLIGPGTFGMIVGAGRTSDDFVSFERVVVLHVGSDNALNRAPPGPILPLFSPLPTGPRRGPVGPVVDPRQSLAKRVAPDSVSSLEGAKKIKIEIPSFGQAFTPSESPPPLRAGKLVVRLLPDAVLDLSKLLTKFDLRVSSDLNRFEIDGAKPMTVSSCFDFFVLLFRGGSSVS